MDDVDYGKLLWTDDPPKNPAWKTALLLFVTIFLLNYIYTQQMTYLILSVISAGLYLYFSISQKGIGNRMKIYENGILASIRARGSIISIPTERFFRRNLIGKLELETKGLITKKNRLVIGYEGKWFSTNLVNKEGFVLSCKKLKKEVVS